MLSWKDDNPNLLSNILWSGAVTLRTGGFVNGHNSHSWVIQDQEEWQFKECNPRVVWDVFDDFLPRPYDIRNSTAIITLLTDISRNMKNLIKQQDQYFYFTLTRNSFLEKYKSFSVILKLRNISYWHLVQVHIYAHWTFSQYFHLSFSKTTHNETEAQLFTENQCLAKIFLFFSIIISNILILFRTKCETNVVELQYCRGRSSVPSGKFQLSELNFL